MKKVARKCIAFILVVLIIRETDIPDIFRWLNSPIRRGPTFVVNATLMSERLKIMQARAQKMLSECNNRGRAVKEVKPVGKQGGKEGIIANSIASSHNLVSHNFTMGENVDKTKTHAWIKK